MPSKKTSNYFVVFYILHTIRFYNFTLYTSLGVLLNLIDIVCAIYFFVCFIQYLSFKRRKTFFEKSLIILYLVFVGSILVGYSNGQDPLRIAKWYSGTFLQFGFVFYLLYKKTSSLFFIDLLKRLLIGYCFITILCYIQYPDCWFGRQDADIASNMQSALENRGLIRFFLPCKMLVPLFLFYYAFNYYKKKSSVKLLILLFFLLLIGNRFPLAVSCIILTIIVLTSKSISFTLRIKLGFALCAIVCAAFFIPVTRHIIDSLILLSTEGGTDGVSDENIRLIAVSYYFSFNDGNTLRDIIGNGIQCYGADPYSKKLAYAFDVLRLCESDVGFCELFVYFGIIGLVAYLLWCYGCLKIKISDNFKFIKYYFVFIMICMICGGYWFENIYIIISLSYILIMNNDSNYNSLVKIEKKHILCKK